MEQRIQLKHPRGKKAVSMSRGKYEFVKSRLLHCLRADGQATFSEMSKAIEKELKRNRGDFQGSLPWYIEWVKLDLEARKIIKRVAGTSPQEYRIST